MTAQPHRPAEPDPQTGPDAGHPVPRDLPDQQARTGEDPWDADPRTPAADADGTGEDLPGTDEAGTGPRGAQPSSTVDPEPEPQESTD